MGRKKFINKNDHDNQNNDLDKKEKKNKKELENKEENKEILENKNKNMKKLDEKSFQNLEKEVEEEIDEEVEFDDSNDVKSLKDLEDSISGKSNDLYLNKVKSKMRPNNQLDQALYQAAKKTCQKTSEKVEEYLNEQMLESLFGNLHLNPIRAYHFVSSYFNELKEKMDQTSSDHKLISSLENEMLSKAKFAFANQNDISEIFKKLDNILNKFFRYQSNQLSGMEKDVIYLITLADSKVNYNSFHPKTAYRLKMVSRSYLIRHCRQQVREIIDGMTKRVIDFWVQRLKQDPEHLKKFEEDIGREDIGIWIVVKNKDFLFPKLV